MLQILDAMDFEFGEVAQLTDVWEDRFDQLLDWMLWNEEASEEFTWVGLDWGERGGRAARELALWVQLQREFRRRTLLTSEAVRRLEAINFRWEPEVGREQTQPVRQVALRHTTGVSQHLTVLHSLWR